MTDNYQTYYDYNDYVAPQHFICNNMGGLCEYVAFMLRYVISPNFKSQVSGLTLDGYINLVEQLKLALRTI